MVFLKGVTKAYGSTQVILDQVDLKLDRGSFLFVLGGSGVGKTTLLKLIALEEKPTHGLIEIFGQKIDDLSLGRSRLMRQALGYVPQKTDLIWDLSVEENITLALSTVSKSKKNNIPQNWIHEMIQKFGLSNKWHQAARNLSGGEAQRVQVVQTLLRKPDLIVADEPTGAQDSHYRWVMMELFSKLNQGGTTVLIATHDRELLRKVRKPTVTLERGKILIERNAACFL